MIINLSESSNAYRYHILELTRIQANNLPKHKKVFLHRNSYAKFYFNVEKQMLFDVLIKKNYPVLILFFKFIEVKYFFPILSNNITFYFIFFFIFDAFFLFLKLLYSVYFKSLTGV